MSIRYVFNPFSAALDVVDVDIPEEEFYFVDENLETNKMIPLSYMEKEKTERILLNGLELSKGSDKDYVILNGIINFNNGVLSEGDRIKINYIRRY